MLTDSIAYPLDIYHRFYEEFWINSSKAADSEEFTNFDSKNLNHSGRTT